MKIIRGGKDIHWKNFSTPTGARKLGKTKEIKIKELRARVMDFFYFLKNIGIFILLFLKRSIIFNLERFILMKSLFNCSYWRLL